VSGDPKGQSPVVESKTGVDGEMQKWVQKMVRSARQYYKLCPYFDKKTLQCFLKLGGKCDRDGRFDTCHVFVEFLQSKYVEYKSKKRVLPMDFLDVTV